MIFMQILFMPAIKKVELNFNMDQLMFHNLPEKIYWIKMRLKLKQPMLFA